MSPILISILISLFHPFFVSLTEVHQNKVENTMEMSVRIFSDDLEEALRKIHPGKKVDVLHPQNPSEMQGWIDEYVQKHLQVKISGAALRFSILGTEQQSESTWIYYEAPVRFSNTPPISVKNTLLIDEHPEQVNLVRYKAGREEKNYRLSRTETQVVLGF